MMNALNAVKFGAVQASKTATPNSARLLLTGEDRGKIFNVPTDGTTDELFLTRDKGQLLIGKETYDPGTGLTAISNDAVTADELGVIISLSQKAVDTAAAPGGVQEDLKPILKLTLNGANISAGDAYQKAVAAKGVYDKEKAVVDLFKPILDWLKQS